MKDPVFIDYKHSGISSEKSLIHSEEFYHFLDKRRSVRDFTDEAVSREVIENILKTAATSPSGAHKQPWMFIAVSNASIKQKIRQAAEKEEKEFYENRASAEWLEDLKILGTDWKKEFLETAPWIIVVFRKAYNLDGEIRSKNYYTQESVGIACGFLIAAIHQAGLVTLTHTPSPMAFLSEILGRPENEKPYLLLPVGYPHQNAKVPDLKRKDIKEQSIFME